MVSWKKDTVVVAVRHPAALLVRQVVKWTLWNILCSLYYIIVLWGCGFLIVLKITLRGIQISDLKKRVIASKRFVKSQIKKKRVIASKRFVKRYIGVRLWKIELLPVTTKLIFLSHSVRYYWQAWQVFKATWHWLSGLSGLYSLGKDQLTTQMNMIFEVRWCFKNVSMIFLYYEALLIYKQPGFIYSLAFFYFWRIKIGVYS